MRYAGQSFEIPVEVERSWLEGNRERIRAAFHDRHEAEYGHRNEDAGIEFVTLRVAAAYAPPEPSLRRISASGDLADARTETREIHVPGREGGLTADIYDREKLPADARFSGPAVVEESNTTTVVYPDHDCVVGEYGTLRIDVPE
jgi:N-methylhydantoinase A/oxoprolinase/acetone carboxylase beta subunit